jgi:hypothetical protein
LQDFDEIGHSNSAKKLLEKYMIGKLKVHAALVLLAERAALNAQPCCLDSSSHHTHV